MYIYYIYIYIQYPYMYIFELPIGRFRCRVAIHMYIYIVVHTDMYIRIAILYLRSDDEKLNYVYQNTLHVHLYVLMYRIVKGLASYSNK